MMICLPPDQQIACHNWYILSLYPESRQDIWGPKIKTLRYPLFPPGILGEINDRIIDIFDRQTLMGGSSEQEENLYGDIFRLPEDKPAKKRTLDGGARPYLIQPEPRSRSWTAHQWRPSSPNSRVRS